MSEENDGMKDATVQDDILLSVHGMLHSDLVWKLGRRHLHGMKNAVNRGLPMG